MIGEKGGKRSFFLHFLHSWFLAVVNGSEELEVLSICAMSYFDCVHEANSLRVPKFNSMKEKNKQHTHNSSNVKKLSCMISAHVRTAHLNCHQFIRRVVQIISLSFFKQFVALLLLWCIVECFFSSCRHIDSLLLNLLFLSVSLGFFVFDFESSWLSRSYVFACLFVFHSNMNN